MAMHNLHMEIHTRDTKLRSYHVVKSYLYSHSNYVRIMFPSPIRNQLQFLGVHRANY